ncbi:MAG: MBL fold metallo-hydrolase [Candidatus Limimorpha sp.]
MELVRIIHPVGQGGFYTESLKIDNKEYLYVYDCGSVTAGEPEKTIQSAIPDGQDIEILFISHFDEDHVNGIKELVNHRTIKKVVLPQIDKLHWFYILTNAMDNGHS